MCIDWKGTLWQQVSVLMVYKGFWNHVCFQRKPNLLHKVFLGPLVSYALENEEALVSLERRILRCVFGAVHGSKWRRRYNCEMCKLYNEMDLVKHIRINRIQLAGQLGWMCDDKNPKKNIHCQARRERWDWKTKFEIVVCGQQKNRGKELEETG